MRTIEEVLADLRACAQKAANGQNVSAERVRLEAELKEHGIRVQPSQPQTLATRGGSRFVGPNADADHVRELAAGGHGGSIAQRGSQPGQRGGGASGSLAGTMTKALAEGTSSAGGVLVPVQVSNEIAELVRARVAVTAMGPTFVPVAKELDLPYISSGATSYYVQENAPIPVSEETFALVPKLRPKELAALVPVSNRLLRDAETNPALESALRADMAASLSLRQDLAFLQGFAATEPLGIRNQTGLTAAPDLGANGANITLADLKRFVHGLRQVNAPFARPGWIFAPKFLAYLDSLTDSTGRPLLDAGLLSYDSTGGGGKLLGFPFRTTSMLPTGLTRGTSTDATYVIFSSDWNECWIGENQDLTIDASNQASYSPDGGTTTVHTYQSRQTLFRATAAHDIALRRPEFFSVWEGVRV